MKTNGLKWDSGRGQLQDTKPDVLHYSANRISQVPHRAWESVLELESTCKRLTIYLYPLANRFMVIVPHLSNRIHLNSISCNKSFILDMSFPLVYYVPAQIFTAGD